MVTSTIAVAPYQPTGGRTSALAQGRWGLGMPSHEQDFTIWVANEPHGPGHLGSRGAMLRTGPQVAKIVTISDYGDAATGAVSKRELRVRTVPRHPRGPGYDFDNPTRSWSCENDELERLLAFLHSDVSDKGRYRVIDTSSPAAALIELLSSEDLDVEAIVEALAQTNDLGNVLAALARSPAGLSAAATAVIDSRRKLIAQVRELIADPGATESNLQPLIQRAHWLFGGKFVGVADRRSLTQLDQYDIPLLTADGTLHVVELKGPWIPALVRLYRNHWIVGTAVHEATSQAMSYIRTLDEQGLGLQATYAELGEGYKLRRVRATVVIGSAQHVQGATREQIELALRTYNGHLSRVEVITYDELLDAAERALDFDNASLSPTSRPRLIDVRTADPQTRPSTPRRSRPRPAESADPWVTPPGSVPAAKVDPLDDPRATPPTVHRSQDEPPF